MNVLGCLLLIFTVIFVYLEDKIIKVVIYIDLFFIEVSINRLPIDIEMFQLEGKDRKNRHSIAHGL